MHPQEAGATEVLANLSIGAVVGIAAILTILRIVFLNPAKLVQPGRVVDVSAPARGFAEILESLIIAGVLVFLVIRPFFLQAFFIPSQSMEPTLLGHDAGPTNYGENYTDTVHDHIFVNKLVYRYSKPHHGDVVVFRAPAYADLEHPDGSPKKENILIKRLIGEPGDTIEVKEDGVYRNGQKVNEPVYKPGEAVKGDYNIKEPMSLDHTSSAKHATQGDALKLGANQYFMMGDNRNNSNDSRFWGPLEGDRIIGKAMFIFMPLNRIGGIH